MGQGGGQAGGNEVGGTRACGVGGRREMRGGAPESSVGATRGALVPLFGLSEKPNNWSDLAGDEGVDPRISN